MTKPNKSFRIDPKLIEKANKIGLPIVEIFEAALAAATDSKECPYCRQDIGLESRFNRYKDQVEKWAEAGNVEHSSKLFEKLDKISQS